MSQIYTIKNGNEALTSHSGLALIGVLLNHRTNLSERLNAITLPECACPQIDHADLIFSMTGLISLGKPDFNAIEPFRGDDFFKDSLWSGKLSGKLDVASKAGYCKRRL